MMRILTPSLVSQSAKTRPVGPAPIIKTSVCCICYAPGQQRTFTALIGDRYEENLGEHDGQSKRLAQGRTQNPKGSGSGGVVGGDGAGGCAGARRRHPGID